MNPTIQKRIQTIIKENLKQTYYANLPHILKELAKKRKSYEDLFDLLTPPLVLCKGQEDFDEKNPSLKEYSINDIFRTLDLDIQTLFFLIDVLKDNIGFGKSIENQLFTPFNLFQVYIWIESLTIVKEYFPRNGWDLTEDKEVTGPSRNMRRDIEQYSKDYLKIKAGLKVPIKKYIRERV